MEQGPSWKANCPSASQEVSYILWDPKLITAFTKACRASHNIIKDQF
jgi:hypothetical protein